MIKYIFIPGISLITLFAAMMVIGCTTVSPYGNYSITTVPVFITPQNPGSADCVLTPCHGVDLTCGPAISEVCTEVYQLGDKCRRFVNCTIDDNKTCRMETIPGFDACKSCILVCLNESRGNPSLAFACEEKC